MPSCSVITVSKSTPEDLKLSGSDLPMFHSIHPPYLWRPPPALSRPLASFWNFQDSARLFITSTNINFDMHAFHLPTVIDLRKKMLGKSLKVVTISLPILLSTLAMMALAVAGQEVGRICDPHGGYATQNCVMPPAAP